MKQKVLRLLRNERGRDFVVGDIHFKTIDLHKGLNALGFDRSVDRVIAVGDLIDRGPGVLDGLRLLGEPWFFTVQGNHEQMLIDADTGFKESAREVLSRLYTAWRLLPGVTPFYSSFALTRASLSPLSAAPPPHQLGEA